VATPRAVVAVAAPAARDAVDGAVEDSRARGARAMSDDADVADAAQRRFKIYTKTGDEGASCLYNMERRDKDDGTFAALGDVDECNVACGIAREFCVDAGNGLEGEVGVRAIARAREREGGVCMGCFVGVWLTDEHERAQLLEIQSRLLDIGSAVATPLTTSSDTMVKRAEFSYAHVERLEGWIDAHDAALPPLTNFVTPSGGKSSVFLHQARVVCRRAERSCVPLTRDGAVPSVVRVYLNRLSDYFFTAARRAAAFEGRAEEIYKKASS